MARWKKYIFTCSLGGRTFTHKFDAKNDEDAHSRGLIKVVKAEEKRRGEVNAWSITDDVTKEVTHSSVYLSILDYI